MKEKLSDSELISLLGLYHSIECKIADRRAVYTNHFLNAVLLVLGGGIVIMTAMSDIWYKYLFLILCGVLASTLSVLMFKINKRTYRNQLEIIAKCGKIEDLLSLNDKEIYGGNEYWQNEGIMTIKHLTSRKETKSKDDFVNSNVRGGQIKLIFALFIVLFLFGSFLFLYSSIELLNRLFLAIS